MLDRSETVRQYIIIKFVMLNDVKAPAWSGSNALLSLFTRNEKKFHLK